MNLESVDCPYCGASKTEPWGDENGYLAKRCSRCRFVYVSPRPVIEEIDDAARTGLHSTERGSVDVVGKLNFRRGKVAMFRQRLPKLLPSDTLTRSDIRWLDVGCGFGELVAAAGTILANGARVEGIDPCIPKVNVARRHGIDVSSRSLSDIDSQFDIVSAINVFSHVPDPRDFIRSLKEILRPGGILILVTGNGADVDRSEYYGPLHLPDHLLFAGIDHIRSLLIEADCEVLKVHQYPYYFREVWPLFAAKQAMKRLIGRPAEPLLNRTGFRSLFISARVVA